MSNSYVTILDKLSKAVETNAKYKVEDALNKNLLAEDARKYETGLLNLLQKDKDLKSHFFSETDGGLVFKKDVFLQFISNKEFLPDSYTRYANKIGLG
ncbi:MAG: site-specific DNA-methyltransferase, partial [Caldisericales bacterium]|nr:site-specific DNA-methyltransferase [Caldisericales bacterium]